MENLMNYITIAMAIVGVLAFLVSAITEVTKGIGFLKRIPTDLQVIALSLAISVIAYFAYCSYNRIEAVWYLVIGVILLGFLVAFVAMYGWDKFTELWSRFKRE